MDQNGHDGRRLHNRNGGRERIELVEQRIVLHKDPQAPRPHKDFRLDHGRGENDKGIPISANIVFVQDRCSKKWLAQLSTDTALGDEEIISGYKRRWDIEVFFKMAKSFLNLAKECQGRSYDHATIVYRPFF